MLTIKIVITKCMITRGQNAELLNAKGGATHITLNG